MKRPVKGVGMHRRPMPLAKGIMAKRSFHFEAEPWCYSLVWGVLGSYCIGERRIDELRPILGNAAGTGDDGAETWVYVRFSIRYLQST